MNSVTVPLLMKLVEAHSAPEACAWFRAQVRLMLEDAADLAAFGAAFVEAGQRIEPRPLPFEGAPEPLRGWCLDELARAALLLLFVEGQRSEEVGSVVQHVLAGADSRSRQAIVRVAPHLRSPAARADTTRTGAARPNAMRTAAARTEARHTGTPLADAMRAEATVIGATRAEATRTQASRADTALIGSPRADTRTEARIDTPLADTRTDMALTSTALADTRTDTPRTDTALTGTPLADTRTDTALTSRPLTDTSTEAELIDPTRTGTPRTEATRTNERPESPEAWSWPVGAVTPLPDAPRAQAWY